MNKIKINSSVKIFSAIVFLVVLVVIFIARGLIFAEDTPSDPTGLTYTNTSSSGQIVVLNWQDNSNNEDSFIVERMSGLENSFISIGQVGTDINTYTDSVPTTSSFYKYRVKACLGSNCSNYSNTVTVQIQWGGGGGTGMTPSSPTGFTASYTSPQVLLSWAAPSSTVSHYNIQKKISTTSTYSLLTTLNDPMAISYTDSTVTAGLSYDYQIQACLSGYSCSSYSTTSIQIPIVIPPAPLTLNATATTSAINLFWTMPSGTNAQTYNLQRRVSGTGTFSAVGGPYGYNITTAIDTNVTAGTTYDYQIQACAYPNTPSNCSEFTQLIGVNVPGGNTAPSAPTNLLINGTVTSTSVPLKWVDNSNNENSFKIERKITSSTTSYSYIGQVGTDIVMYSDTNVTPGSTYNYRVQACSSSGCSSYIELTGIVVPSTTTGNGGNSTSIPNPPSNLTIATSSIMPPVELVWTNNSNNQDKYNIERKLHTASTWTTIIQLQQPNASSYIDSSSNVVPGLSYDYRVQACLSNTGCSAWAVLYDFIIPYINTNQNVNTGVTPSAPTNFIISGSTTYSSVPLKWTDNSNNETSFKIYRKLSSASSYPIFPLIATEPNVTSFTDVTAPQNLFWDYKIQACNGDNCSSFVSLYNITSTGNIVIPPSQNLTTTINNNNLTYTSVPTTATNTLTTSTNTSLSNQNNTTIIPENRQVQKTNIMDITTKSGLENINKNTTINIVTTQIQNLGQAFEKIDTAVLSTKEELIKLVDNNVTNITEKAITTGSNPDIDKINSLKDKIQDNINKSLSSSVTVSTPELVNLEKEISKGLEEVRSIVTKDPNLFLTEDSSSKIGTIMGGLSETITSQSATIAEHGGDLLYKDTNKDGISDYDSVNIYNIDPIKPSPVSVYEGKKINAAEKVLLGFDPTKSDLIKVEIEQPVVSSAPTVPVYKVEDVKLVENKKDIVIKGKALPNSFVTVYIYSTPIMVTVKADNTGQWQYVLDKELENGDHTVYTATVNNSGNIVAKSPAYLFTKTAEAVTLKDLTPNQNVTEVKKPGLLSGKNFYFVIISVIILVIVSLLLIGMSEKRKKVEEIEKIQ